MREVLLKVTGLKADLMTPDGIAYVLENADLTIRRGEIHALVGESGCGKSMTALSIMRLHPKGRCRMSGEVLFEGTDLLKLSEKEMEKIRGRKISMIFQDPMNSLDPLKTVGSQIDETIMTHEKCSAKEARVRTLAWLKKVGLEPSAKVAGQYPFELSGGMQQRVMIAAAASCGPSLLIADEPTTALDVTIQAQILALLSELSRELDLSVLLITHNFGIVAQIADTVSVMYAGRIVESGPVETIFENPAHPYTRALIETVVRPGKKGQYLPSIGGAPPKLKAPRRECPFRPRCVYADEACAGMPALEELTGDEGGAVHTAACFHPLDEVRTIDAQGETG